MEEKKINFRKYTKEELVLILEHVNTVLGSYPWIVRDAVDAVDRMRLDDLRQKRDKFAEEADDMRRKAAKLMTTGKSDMKTLSRIKALFEKASEADKSYDRLQIRIDRLLGIRLG